MHYQLISIPYRGIYSWLLVVACLLFPQALWAEEGRSNLTIMPGRVIIDPANPYPSVMLKNSGTARGDYNIELIDMTMLESGEITALSGRGGAPHSARPYLHVVPRSVSLSPGEVKRLQLALRKPAKLEPGEYRAHLKMRIANDAVDADSTETEDKSVSISAKARMVIIIPVILRHGETSYAMQIESPKLVRGANGAPKLDMYLRRSGNRSSMNDISVEYVSPEGKSQLITFFPGVPVYREITRRFISVPLDVPNGIDLSAGSLKITCLKPEEEGAEVMAEATLALP